MKWFGIAWSKTIDFSGRSSRKEFWMFALFNSLLCIALLIPCIAFPRTSTGHLLNFLLCAYEVALIVPTLSCGVRRLHDVGMSGWWLLIYLIPPIGLLIIVFLAFDSVPGWNKYGPNPKPASTSSGATSSAELRRA